MSGKRTIAALAAVSMLAAGAAAAPAAVNVSQSGWAWGNPSPQGNSLDAIAFQGPIGYAVGADGTALRTTDDGSSWSGLVTGTAAQLTRVQAIGAGTVVIGSANGCVLRISSDGGQTFTRIFSASENACSDPIQAFSFVSPQIGFLLLRDGSVLATADGGSTFSRETALPGTPASSSAGSSTPVEIHFTTATSGIAFSGPSAAFSTSDGGVSWTPLAVPSGSNVAAVHFFDASNAYAIGAGTLLRSTDGGKTWAQQPIASGNSFSAIDCETSTICTLVASAGDRLLTTTDGGKTATTTTPSSALLAAVGYAASGTRVLAVGAGGATVMSYDGGKTFVQNSSDIGGSYSGLRASAGGLVAAPGANGTFALSTNMGASWSAVGTQTSAALRDVAFASPQVGYALDATGGLQQTTNAGASWKTLSPGTPQPADAVAAVGGATVLLVGPTGVYRSLNGGRFNAVGGPIATAQVSGYDIAPGAVFAYGQRALLVSRTGGSSWLKVRLPQTDRKGRSPIAVQSIAFATASTGMLLDSHGRVWLTHNAGGGWNEVLSTGSADGEQLAASDASHAYLTVRSYAGADGAYVLRTDDGGASWHPQSIAEGDVSAIVALGQQNAAVLVPGPANRWLFSTATGGDAGATGTLSITTPSRTLKHSRKSQRVTIEGVLKGALGGEQVVVSQRAVNGTTWSHHVVTAGANGGSFTTSWQIKSSAVFVAQWAGDSGRASIGSRTLIVKVG